MKKLKKLTKTIAKIGLGLEEINQTLKEQQRLNELSNHLQKAKPVKEIDLLSINNETHYILDASKYEIVGQNFIKVRN